MSHPRRILYISELVELGGGEKSLLYFLERLDRTRYSPLVLCPEPGSLTDELRRLGVPFRIERFTPVRTLAGVAPLVSVGSILRVARVMRQERSELVHSNGYSGTILASLPARWRRIPLVWTAHGWSSGKGVKGRFLNHFTSKVLAVSNPVKEFLCKPGRFSPGKVETLFLGVDPDQVASARSSTDLRSELGIPLHTPLIGMIARFQAIKGHLVFLRAAARIKAVLPECRFLLVGADVFRLPAERGYTEQVQEWIRELGLEKQVICTGFRTDIPRVLSILDSLALSSYRESFGVTLVEAMAAGVPAVATRCAGPEDIIEHGRSGLLVPVGDDLALSQALLSLLKDPAYARRLADAARQRVRDHFNIELQTRKLERVYDELLSSPS
jgi:glycosyltransferase involved in cell wall biosynthesis